MACIKWYSRLLMGNLSLIDNVFIELTFFLQNIYKIYELTTTC